MTAGSWLVITSRAVHVQREGRGGGEVRVGTISAEKSFVRGKFRRTSNFWCGAIRREKLQHPQPSTSLQTISCVKLW